MNNVAIEFPPIITELIGKLHNEVVIRRVATDAINEYGVHLEWEVSIKFLDSVCKLCGSRALLMDVIRQCVPDNGHKHRWTPTFIESIYGCGKTLEEAFDSAELDAISFNSKIAN